VIQARPTRGNFGLEPADIRAIPTSVFVSRPAAAEFITMFSTLERLYRGRGTPLPARWRRQIAAFIEATYVGTSVDASTQVVEALRMSQLEADTDEVISTKKAAAILETTEANVRDLCKRGRLDAMQVGRRWWIAPQSVENYRLERERRTA
jgi:hypothetical protein